MLLLKLLQVVGLAASCAAFGVPNGRIGRPRTTALHVWYESGAERRPIIAGNWKCNPATAPEAEALLKLLAANVRAMGDAAPEIAIFPPAPFLAAALALTEGSGISVGAQDVSLRTGGAFTGEMAASMVRSLGCDYALVGHSERRVLYDETDAEINAKVRTCLEQPGLKVLLCVGETLDEYRGELLENVVSLQIKKALAGVAPADAEKRVVVAYEPVWAIGTGEVATPLQAQEAHVLCRRALGDLFGEDIARRIRIQYGGSVNPDSIDRLMSEPDVDGALVGGASLSAEAFSRVCAFSRGGAAAAAAVPPPREFTARPCVGCANALGESPVWSARERTLFWVSATEGELWRWNLSDAPYKIVPRFGTTLGFVALRASGGLLLGGEDAILTIDSDGREATALRPPPAEGDTRPNDGRVDREGRMVMGQYNNYHRSGASEGAENAGLYRFASQDDAFEELLDYRFRVSNCCCFPEDGRTLYFADTPTRTVYAFDYPESGKPTNRREIWRQPPDWPGGPDGAQVDAEGFLWVALNGAGRVIRIDPADGRVDAVVFTPGCPTPTSCTFGGPDLDELFITTAARPAGGALYRLKVPFGIKGLPEPEWAG